MNFAQTIGNVDLAKINVFDFFSWYFDNPTLVKFKVVNGKAMYGCKIRSLLFNNRYIIAVVNDMQPNQIKMNEIYWDCLQLRSLDENIQVPTHTYNQKSDTRSMSEIKLYKKTDTCFHYETGFRGLYLSLLINKTQSRVFSEKGVLQSAIEMFNTIISFHRE